MLLEGREERWSLKTRILKNGKDQKNEWGRSEQEDHSRRVKRKNTGGQRQNGHTNTKGIRRNKAGQAW